MQRRGSGLCRGVLTHTLHSVQCEFMFLSARLVRPTAPALQPELRGVAANRCRRRLPSKWNRKN